MTIIYNADELEDGRIIRDGEGVRVRLTLADAALTPIVAPIELAIRHRAGQLSIADGDVRQKRVEATKARLSDAWRTAPPIADRAAAGPIGLRNGPDASASARNARDARLRSAWQAQ